LCPCTFATKHPHAVGNQPRLGSRPRVGCVAKVQADPMQLWDFFCSKECLRGNPPPVSLPFQVPFALFAKFFSSFDRSTCALSDQCRYSFLREIHLALVYPAFSNRATPRVQNWSEADATFSPALVGEAAGRLRVQKWFGSRKNGGKPPGERLDCWKRNRLVGLCVVQYTLFFFDETGLAPSLVRPFQETRSKSAKNSRLVLSKLHNQPALFLSFDPSFPGRPRFLPFFWLRLTPRLAPFASGVFFVQLEEKPAEKHNSTVEGRW
jgi:hypothetical protein